MSANKQLADRLLDLLAQPEIKQVNFSYKSVVVTGMRYSMVSEAIVKGRITCHVGVDQSGVPAGSKAKAQYKSGGKMYFPDEFYGVNDDERFHMLHEATHAMHDLFGTPTSPVQILGIDDEVVSMVACALFSRLTMVNLKLIRKFVFAGNEVNGPEDDALAVADKVLLGSGNTVKDPRTIRVDALITQGFRDKVAVKENLVGGRAGIVDWYTGFA